MKRICQFVLIGFLLLNLSGCEAEDPDEILSVPYHSQLLPYYCGPACLQMWQDYDGHEHFSQVEIAVLLGTTEAGTSLAALRAGVGELTGSPGWIASIGAGQPGAPGDIISGCVEGMFEGNPSILLCFYGSHFVLAIGYKGVEYDPITGKPVAHNIFIHDPAAGNGKTKLTAGELFSQYFHQSSGKYWAIVPHENVFWWGIQSHDDFVLRRGTYYGGPSIYDPKGLLGPNPDPLPY
jgi:hypothetical protein